MGGQTQQKNKTKQTNAKVKPTYHVIINKITKQKTNLDEGINT